MKVLQVLHDYLPEHVGGAEVHAHQIARVLSGRGNEVVCLYTVREPSAAQGSVSVVALSSATAGRTQPMICGWGLAAARVCAS